MAEGLPWFHASPLPPEKIQFTQRCVQANPNLNALTLAKIQFEFARKKPWQHSRPNKYGQKWDEGVYIGGSRFQLNCSEKDGIVLISSMSYDKGAFQSKKQGR